MSLTHSLSRSLIQTLTNSLVGVSVAPELKYAWNLDGVNYGESSSWNADTGIYFKLTVTVGEVNVDKNILGDEDSNKERVQQRSDGDLSFTFVNSSGSRRTSEWPVRGVEGDVYTLEVDQGVNYTGAGFRMRQFDSSGAMVGEVINPSGGPIKPTDLNLKWWGTNNNQAAVFNGSIHKVELGHSAADDHRIYEMNEGPGFLDGKTMINSLSTRPFAACRGDVLKGNGVDVQGKMSPVSLSGDFNISVNSINSGITESPVLLGDGANLTWIRIDSTGSVRIIKGNGVTDLTTLGSICTIGERKDTQV